MVRKGALDAYIRDNSKRNLDGLLGLREARTMNGWVEDGNRKSVSFPSSKDDVGIASANSQCVEVPDWRAIAVKERE
ncbi:hypothetical protein M441DRAFT_57336 [Trichoderma asperellum CBS 433.97]|uniref:Uncharacterized protein n=1 Tax=Trichoderma asperellum (strain ATCC 204424 / CBS 433.97 / NBRC 101777) TaxID=1042311 RepID=A0A2T3ZCX0_TRIA4|nr:hypothetical protein M441DRAFT_57336 [Trichoderma asperellum CBS 433.97]PTB42642.1 hypothetical protein M441DRAFT_57336 [Trichoderma asperellum CBS 433.97]